MPFNLYVIRPDGVEFKTLRSPYDAREDTAVSVVTIAGGDGFLTLDDAQAFAARVAAAPLGETVTFDGDDLAFRTEES